MLVDNAQAARSWEALTEETGSRAADKTCHAVSATGSQSDLTSSSLSLPDSPVGAKASVMCEAYDSMLQVDPSVFSIKGLC